MHWKKPTRRKSSRTVSRQPLLFLCLAALLASLVPALRAEDKVKQWQEQFDREPRATGKVHLLSKLGPAQFAEAIREGQENNFSRVALTFEKFGSNVRTAFELLKKQEPDADRHSSGYRQLELLVRRGIREVEETIIAVPEDLRPPLQIVRDDLVATDDELIHKLFPRRTKEPEPPASSKEEKP
jgi:hypothetical protein